MSDSEDELTSFASMEDLLAAWKVPARLARDVEDLLLEENGEYGGGTIAKRQDDGSVTIRANVAFMLRGKSAVYTATPRLRLLRSAAVRLRAREREQRHARLMPTEDDLEAAERARAEREARRAERLASRPAPVLETKTALCAACGKKPARLGDLCKRCAHAAGLMPRGKIGGA